VGTTFTAGRRARGPAGVGPNPARIVTGNTHYRDKLLSLFELHTEAIRKNKAVKPTEFGKLV
jgi:hypothetical protein